VFSGVYYVARTACLGARRLVALNCVVNASFGPMSSTTSTGIMSEVPVLILLKSKARLE
jgi:hypothetical protein